jgi:mandelate racemase
MLAMQLAPLTFKSIRARAVVLKLRRPVVARIATITDWPLILIDLSTEEGIVGRSYLEPYAQLTAELKTPIQIGENFYGPRDLHIALQTKACDLVMPDFMRIGGVTGWLRASAIAGAAGIPMSTHLYPEVAAHVMRVTETAHWLEWQDWADPVLQRPYEIRDGLLHIPDVPGVGLEWNEDAVAANLANL